MIGKQKKGRGFRGLLDYLESSPGSRLIGGNMSGRNARELAREFKLSRQLNPDVERAVYHVALSAAKSDRLDDDQWCEIAFKYMERMGFDCNQFATYRHNNTDDDHIHIVASRIRLDTAKVVHDGWDYVRSEKVLRELEKEYGLTQVQGSREKLTRTTSTGQIRRIRREQQEYENGKRSIPPELPIKVQLQELIDRATTDHPTMPQLIERLQLLGVEVRHGFTRNGKSKGISYSMNGQQFSGTSLGAAYTFPGLQKHKGVDYQPQRDSLSIEQLLLNPVKPNQIDQPQNPKLEVETQTTQEFVPPVEDENQWQAVHNYLVQKRGLPNNIVQALHESGLVYSDEQQNIVFIMRGHSGEKLGALVWEIQGENNTRIKYTENTKLTHSWFHMKLGGKPDEEIQRVFLCQSPIDALSVLAIDIKAHSSIPRERTMYLAVDSPKYLPLEFLKTIKTIGVAFNNDSQGNEAAHAVIKRLPQAKRITPNTRDWNQELLAHSRQEQQERKQHERGFSR